MNSSLYTADRVTHLKIVAVALMLATVIAGLGIALSGSRSASRLFADQGPGVMQPDRSNAMAQQTNSAIRIR
jgi:hypothetical protein